MAHLDSEYWTLGQVTAWCCTRNEKDVAIVAGRDYLGLEILLAMQGVLAETPEDCPNLLLQNLRVGRIVATARLAHDAPRHPVPKEHWKLLTLTSGCVDTNAPCKPTRDELCLSWRSSFKNMEGCDYSGSELPHSEISSINDAVKKISKLPDWLDLAFSPSEIKALFPPCREDEPWWDLQETIGFITHGYPLIARWRNGETGEKMFRESLEQLRKKLQGGEIACKKQFYDSSARSSEGWAQLPWSDVTENELMNFELLFDNTLLNALSLNGTPYQVKFKAVDVRELFHPIEAVAAQDYRNGAPGRPTSKQLVEDELRRRAAAKNIADTLAEESRHLSQWLSSTHPVAPKMSPKTIENNIRSLYQPLKRQVPAA